METCKAIVEQGVHKGSQCPRPKSENGYCGKHQKAAMIELAEQQGLHKCKTHRCTTMLSSGDYCESCMKQKTEERASQTLCKGVVAQGQHKGTPCDKQASTSEGYCGKHTLQILIQKAKEEGKRICDDGKRVCRNYTLDGKVKCEECLIGIREKEREQHKQLRESGNCLGCGTTLEKAVTGFRKETVQRCEPCYNKLKQTESTRDREQRNYNKERKDNITRHYQEYVTSANKRGIEFQLSVEVFTTYVNQPCTYCHFYNASEVIGIDRVDNSIGYVETNITPCCKPCNKMKSDYTVSFFKEHIRRIYEIFVIGGDSDTEEEEVDGTKKSYVRPKHIVNMYNSGTLDEYIQQCIEDERSPLLIEKLKELATLHINESEARKYVKNVLKSEANSKSIETKKRVSTKELFGYLKLKNIEKCIEVYGQVHGTPEGFREDIVKLVGTWNEEEAVNQQEFKRVLIKYQNRRNNTV